MKNSCELLITEAQEVLDGVTNRAAFEGVKASFFGSSGKIRALFKLLSEASSTDKPRLGQEINRCKLAIESIFAKKLQVLEEQELDRRLGERPDPSIPVEYSGGIHPLSRIQERMVDIFRRVGFSIALSTELETGWFCYDALNMPDSHPARDTHDSFFLSPELALDNVSKHESEGYILRSHTSTVQVRTMLSEEPPLRILSPGRTFRRDTTDATHSPVFHQCEGLVVDESIGVADLKAVLDFFFKELFGNRCETRFRPSFFPFTEPSFEVDFRAPHLGKLGDSWIEVAGCGTVNPKVFDAVGYDPMKWSGYAFGFGIERIAMLMYGVDDIRLFYQNDTRFLRQL